MNNLLYVYKLLKREDLCCLIRVLNLQLCQLKLPVQFRIVTQDLTLRAFTHYLESQHKDRFLPPLFSSRQGVSFQSADFMLKLLNFSETQIVMDRLLVFIMSALQLRGEWIVINPLHCFILNEVDVNKFSVYQALGKLSVTGTVDLLIISSSVLRNRKVIQMYLGSTLFFIFLEFWQQYKTSIFIFLEFW